MPEISEIFTLHKYYIWANYMRTCFDEIINNPNQKQNVDEGYLITREYIYMSYWYGGLFVVVEGWKELGLHDDKINKLIESPNVDLLRRYRNGVFPYQKNYFDDRFRGFIEEGINCVEWIRELNRQFGRWFLEWFDEQKKN